MGKPEGKRLLGRNWPRWEDNIKVDLEELECGGGIWTGSSWLRIGTGDWHWQVLDVSVTYRKFIIVCFF